VTQDTRPYADGSGPPAPEEAAPRRQTRLPAGPEAESPARATRTRAKGFTILQNDTIDAHVAGLSHFAFCLYVWLMRVADRRTCQSYYKVSSMARLFGNSEKSVRRAIAELKEAGLIGARPRYDAAGGRSSDAYQILPPSAQDPAARAAPMREAAGTTDTGSGTGDAHGSGSAAPRARMPAAPGHQSPLPPGHGCPGPLDTDVQDPLDNGVHRIKTHVHRTGVNTEQDSAPGPHSPSPARGPAPAPQCPVSRTDRSHPTAGAAQPDGLDLDPGRPVAQEHVRAIVEARAVLGETKRDRWLLALLEASERCGLGSGIFAWALRTTEAAGHPRRIGCPGAYFTALMRAAFQEFGHEDAWPGRRPEGPEEQVSPEDLEAFRRHMAGLAKGR
jgi:hypothetical protein